MGLTTEQWEFLKDLAKLIQFIADYQAGLIITGGELWRTEYQQRYNVDHGLSGTMNSYHLKRLAIDLNFIKGGKVVECPETIGDYWESLDAKNKWGGRWKRPHDPGHFERRD